jgi:hypothetical protein
MKLSMTPMDHFLIQMELHIILTTLALTVLLVVSVLIVLMGVAIIVVVPLKDQQTGIVAVAQVANILIILVLMIVSIPPLVYLHHPTKLQLLP